MKKFIVLPILLLIIICNIYNKQEFSLSTYFNQGKLSYYTNTATNTLSVKLADSYMSLTKPNAKIIGESMYFNNLEVISAIKTLKASVKFTEYLSEQNLTLIYCYTSLIPTYKYVKSNKINLQISTCEEYSIIGWPLIYGSF